jgi:hypothetical protein
VHTNGLTAILPHNCRIVLLIERAVKPIAAPGQGGGFRMPLFASMNCQQVMIEAKPLLIASGTGLALFAFATGCLPTTDRLAQTMEAGRSNVVTTIPIAREFRSVFTNCEVSICAFLPNRPRFRDVQLTADLFDRYLLHLNLEVEFVSRRRLDVVSYNVKGFYLSEVTLISTADNGNTAYHFGDSLRFGEAQWQALMTNGFRFDLIAINVKTNQPVERFRQERDRPLSLWSRR